MLPIPAKAEAFCSLFNKFELIPSASTLGGLQLHEQEGSLCGSIQTPKIHVCPPHLSALQALASSSLHQGASSTEEDVSQHHAALNQHLSPEDISYSGSGVSGTCPALLKPSHLREGEAITAPSSPGCCSYLSAAEGTRHSPAAPVQRLSKSLSFLAGVGNSPPQPGILCQSCKSHLVCV